MTYTALVVDDDPAIARVLAWHLEREALQVHQALDGHSAWELFCRLEPDLVLLDVMLPDRSGLDICSAIRRSELRQPGVILMSARGDEVDAVLGLSIGADDYVRKPFGVVEIIARCRAVLQRVERETSRPIVLPRPPEATSSEGRRESLRLGPLVIDPHRQELRMGTERVALTPTELDLLWLLASEPGRVFRRDDLLDRVLGYESEAYGRTIDCHVARLRKKLAGVGLDKELVQTVHRVGYRLQDRLVPEVAVAG